MGSAGVAPCIKCKNVMYTRARAAAEADDYIVTLANTDPSKLDARTDEDVWAAADDLVAMHALRRRGTKVSSLSMRRC